MNFFIVQDRWPGSHSVEVLAAKSMPRNHNLRTLSTILTLRLWLSLRRRYALSGSDGACPCPSIWCYERAMRYPVLTQAMHDPDRA
eukprot:3032923-Rhodomonas_salina.2